METELAEINNIYTRPSGIKRIYFKASQRAFVNRLKQEASEICRDEIPNGYINKVCNKLKEGYLYVKENKILGFIVWTIKNTKNHNEYVIRDKPNFEYMLIHLLCAKQTNTNFGYAMLDDAETYCTTHRLILMSLQPLSSKLENYYFRYGFRLEHPGLTTPVMMYKPVAELLNIFSNQLKSDRTQTRKLKRSILSDKTRRLLKNIIENADESDAKLRNARNDIKSNIIYF